MLTRSEQGKISVIQELANAYLNRWPVMMPNQVAPPTSVLVVALREVVGLLQQLGNAPPSVQVDFHFNYTFWTTIVDFTFRMPLLNQWRPYHLLLQRNGRV